MPFDFPGAPNPGDVFTDPTSAASFTWNGYAWMGGAANSLGALVVSDTPPAAPANNSLWFESDTGMLFLRYNDGNSSQWVQLNALPYGAGYMPLRGVSDGSDAPAGQIGEVIAANVTTGMALTSGATLMLTSITLTPGDWDVSGEVWHQTGSAGASQAQAGISTSATTFPATSTLAGARTTLQSTITGSVTVVLALRPARINLTASTPYYLLAYTQFASGAPTASGNIIARRVR